MVGGIIVVIEMYIVIEWNDWNFLVCFVFVGLVDEFWIEVDGES